jgi:hypothetical protein
MSDLIYAEDWLPSKQLKSEVTKPKTFREHINESKIKEDKAEDLFYGIYQDNSEAFEDVKTVADIKRVMKSLDADDYSNSVYKGFLEVIEMTRDNMEESFQKGEKVRNQYGDTETVSRQEGNQVYTDESLKKNNWYHPDKLSKVNEGIRSLVQCSCYWSGSNSFSINYPGGHHVFNGSPDEFARFLSQVQAKDASLPKSQRNISYKQMVQNIVDGKDPVIYIWSSFLNSLKGNVQTQPNKTAVTNEPYKVGVNEAKIKQQKEAFEKTQKMEKDFDNFAEKW